MYYLALVVAMFEGQIFELQAYYPYPAKHQEKFVDQTLKKKLRDVAITLALTD